MEQLYSEIALKNQLNHRLLTKTLETELMERVKRGDRDALSEVVMSNQKLVYSIATRYYSIAAGDQDIEDMVQWGNIGLLHAVRKFDPKKNVRFSTYATWWIRSYIQRGVIYGMQHTVSLDMIGRWKKIRRAANRLEQKLRRTPNLDELSEATGLNVKNVRFIIPIMDRSMSISNDDPDSSGIDDIDHSRFIFQVARRTQTIPGHAAHANMCAEILIKKMRVMPITWQKVIVARFGLGGDEVYYRDIAASLGISKTRVQQIERKALAFLRKELERAGLEFEDFISEP